MKDNIPGFKAYKNSIKNNKKRETIKNIEYFMEKNGKKTDIKKRNLGTDEEKIHDTYEIMNGQEMIQYDGGVDDVFSRRFEKMIKGDPTMGNDNRYANTVNSGWGGDENFGKEFLNRFRKAAKERLKHIKNKKYFGVGKVDTKKNKKYPLNENKKMIRLKFNNIQFNGFDNAVKLIPQKYKKDKLIFEMTDGNEIYRIRWELNKPVLLKYENKSMLNEELNKIKKLMNYSSYKEFKGIDSKTRANEDDVFKKIKDIISENNQKTKLVENSILPDRVKKKYKNGTFKKRTPLTKEKKINLYEDTIKFLKKNLKKM